VWTAACLVLVTNHDIAEELNKQGYKVAKSQIRLPNGPIKVVSDYGAVGVLINASKPADVITVFEHLQNQGKAEESGGLAYLNSLAQYVPSASNIRRYAEIVRERSILRKLVSASDEIATNAFNPQGRAVDRILDEAEQKIFNIGEEGSRMKQGFQSMDSLVVKLLDRVQEMADNPNDITGVPTGFYDLDRMTSGLQAGRHGCACGSPFDGARPRLR
jgi:replicative DNA helicase